MNVKLFIILSLLLTFSHVTKSNEETEDAPSEEENKEEKEEGEEKDEGEEAAETGDAEEEEAEEKAEEAEEGGQELKCNKQILETYGMVGLEVAKPMMLDMCHSIKQSCCQVTDQLKIYENWIQNGEDEDLSERFKYQMRVINLKNKEV